MKIVPLQRQLENLQCLQKSDLDRMASLLTEEKNVPVATQLIREDQSISRIAILSKGWALRYKSLEDGRRQILNFVLPGDLVGFFSLLFNKSEHGVEALTPLAYHHCSREQAYQAFNQSPCLAIAMSWLAGRAERQLSEQIVRVGRRAAPERMAHLFVELHLRLLQGGSSPQEAMKFPITQPLLADTLGMSHVHANRSFRKLVHEGLVAIESGNILLLNIDGLCELANFDATYLAKEPLPSSIAKMFRKKSGETA